MAVKNQVANTSATDKLNKAKAELDKLNLKVVKAEEKYNTLMAANEAELQKKDEAIAKEKTKVAEAKKKLTAATKSGDEAAIAAAQTKVDAAEEGLEKKKEAKKAYQEKVKFAKADYDRLAKDQKMLNTEIDKLAEALDRLSKELEKTLGISLEKKPAVKKSPAKKAEPKKEEPKKEEPKAEVKPEPKKEEPKAEVKPEPKKEEPKAEVKPEPKKEEPKAEVKPEPKKEEPKAEVKPEPKKEEPKKEAKPVAKPEAKKQEPKSTKGNTVPRLKTYYDEVVKPELMKQFSFTNVMQVPRLEKVVLNTGLGDVKDNPKSIQTAINELALISGQKAIVTKAKKSVANFKVREGMNVGAKVTLRGAKMYEFLDKFISIVLPRVRDFKGVPTKSFDGRGNYAMGVKEQLIFPEISYDDVDKIRGFDICIVTSAKTDEHAKGLLKLLGMPFASN